MKLNKSYIVILLIALIAMDNIVTMNAVSVERRRQYRKQKAKWFWNAWFTTSSRNKVITKPIKPTKQKFFAFGKGLVIGLVLGVIYKLIGVGVEKGMTALFGEVKPATPETEPQLPDTLAKIDDVHKLILGDTSGFKAGSWDEFYPSTVTTDVGVVLGATEPDVEIPSTLPAVSDDGTSIAPTTKPPVTKSANAKQTVDEAKLTTAAVEKSDKIFDTTKNAQQVASDPLASTATIGTISTQQKQDFAKIVILAQAQMKNVKLISEKAETDVTTSKNTDKDILPAAQSFWQIAKDFGNSLKTLFSTRDVWKAIAKNILIQIGVAAVITGIAILNPIAGAVAAAAWAAYNFIKDVYGLIKVISSCLREDGNDQNKNCGQNGIAAGMKVVSIVAGFILRKHHRKHHHHRNHRLAKKIRQSRHQE